MPICVSGERCTHKQRPSWTREHPARSAQAIGSTAVHPPGKTVKRLSRTQFAAIGRGDLSDYAVEARDGPIGRLSARTGEADGTVLVVELGPLLFGELVILPLEALKEIDPDTETISVDLSKQQVRQAPRFCG